MSRLTTATLEGYLRERGVVSDPAACSASELTGGVSNDVFAVSQPAGATTGLTLDLVVKQSLPELRVAQTWAAPVERILAEATALRTVRGITPDSVPHLVDVDDVAMTVTMTRAPRALGNLKEALMAGTVELGSARSLGGRLGRWHRRTAGDVETREAFPDTFFDALRVEPYYRHTARVHPGLADVIASYADELVNHRSCLVHGDFTPKNVLAEGDVVCVLDWEVAHFGNPVFDLASMPTHLILKAVHRPDHLVEYRQFAETFLAAYDLEHGPLDEASRRSLTGHIGCLLLARVDGKSPADYLTEPQRHTVRALARRVLIESPASPQAIWEVLREH
jgi:tRNA A-37 threonylcarbamoyl transferase component Bud32